MIPHDTSQDTSRGMMSKMRHYWSTYKKGIIVFNGRHRWFKYAIATSLIVTYTLTQGRFSLADYWSIEERESYLRDEIEALAPQLSTDSLRLKQLRDQGPDQVEYVAREQHLMKSPDEDIYIINE